MSASLNQSVGMSRKFLVSLDKERNKLDVIVKGLTKVESKDVILVSIDDACLVQAHNLIDTAKRAKGIVISQMDGVVQIFNDPFCSIPLYYTDSDKFFRASSDPQDLIDYTRHPYDPVGVWETVLLNGAVWNRTAYRGVKFLPAACCLKINNEIFLNRYWNFEFESDRSTYSLKSGLDDLDDIINQKFLQINKSCVSMGLSGGNDSRLAAHYLAKNKNHFDEIELVTYAAHSRSKEYRYSCEVATALGLGLPRLHLLKDRHYIEAMSYIPQWSAGQISNVHCHLSSYLKEKQSSSKDNIHISNYYTDALFGYECGAAQLLESINESAVYKMVANEYNIPSNIRNQILDDCSMVFESARGLESQFSSLNEFKYITDRNPRFHISLAFIQGQFMGTVLPFADFDVLDIAMKVPIEKRYQKQILSKLISHIDPKLSQIGSSANTEYFYGRKSRLRHGNVVEKMKFNHFRFLNLTSQLISWVSSGRLRFGNPYQTEDQLGVYRKSFDKFSDDVMNDKKILDSLGGGKVEQVFRDDIIIRNLMERYNLICLGQMKNVG